MADGIDRAQATVGAGLAPAFLGDDGRQKVLLLQAGPHYSKAVDAELYTIPGGFLNLMRRKGSLLVPASDQPENPRAGAARETEEELQSDTGPLLAIDPKRLKPMDTDLIVTPWGEKLLVIGHMLELAKDEVTKVQEHIKRLAADPVYRQASADRTINEASGKAEIIGAKIFDLSDVANGGCRLLHEDQRSLFRAMDEHFAHLETIARRGVPAKGYRRDIQGAALGS